MHTHVLYLSANTPVLALIQGRSREFSVLFGDKNVTGKTFSRGILVPRDIFNLAPKTGLNGGSWMDMRPPLLNGGVPVLVTDSDRAWVLDLDGNLFKLGLPVVREKFAQFYPPDSAH